MRYYYTYVFNSFGGPDTKISRGSRFWNTARRYISIEQASGDTLAKYALFTVLLLFAFGFLFFILKEFYPRQTSGNITMADYKNWIARREKDKNQIAPIVPYIEANRAPDDKNTWYTLRTLVDIKKGEKIRKDSIEMVGMKWDTVPFGVIWTGGQFVGCKATRDIPRNSLLRIGNIEPFPPGYYMGAHRAMQVYNSKQK